MTNDLEQANEALDVVDPMANVIDPVDSMVGTANPTPELANAQGNAKPVFNEGVNTAAADIYGTQAQRDQTMIRGNTNNNNTKQYG
jgi:hypothetical protein